MLHARHVEAQRARAARLRTEAHGINGQAATLRGHGEELAEHERMRVRGELENGQLLLRITRARDLAAARGEPIEGDEGLARLVAGLLIDQAQRLGQQMVDWASVVRDLGQRTEGRAEEAEAMVDMLTSLMAQEPTRVTEGDA